MLNYTFVQNVKILTGAQASRQIGELLQQAGYQKAFLVFDEFMKKVCFFNLWNIIDYQYCGS